MVRGQRQVRGVTRVISARMEAEETEETEDTREKRADRRGGSVRAIYRTTIICKDYIPNAWRPFSHPIRVVDCHRPMTRTHNRLLDYPAAKRAFYYSTAARLPCPLQPKSYENTDTDCSILNHPDREQSVTETARTWVPKRDGGPYPFRHPGLDAAEAKQQRFRCFCCQIERPNQS